MEKSVLMLISAIFYVHLSAQTIVTGNVIDKASHQPVEFATVSLIQLPDSTTFKNTVTDKRGKFSIEDVKPGTYRVQCSFIGFDKAETPSFIIEEDKAKHTTGQIELVTESKNLSEVVVTGRRSTLNTSIDRKVYNVDGDIMSRSGSVSDILKNIPSVEVDIEGAVSLRGSADVMILINGKPSPLMGRSRAEVLQQLPANSIERIEVITNPSARYRPDGTSGIINIVLKKNIKNGFNGTTTISGGNRDRHNGNILLNYRPKKWNFFSSYSLRQDTRRRFSTIDRTYRDSNNGSTAGYYNQLAASVTRPLSHILNGGIDYTMNDQSSFGISVGYYSRKQIRKDVIHNLTYNNQNIINQNYDRLRFDPEQEKQKNGALYFQHLFPKEDHELRLEFNLSHSKEAEDNHYTTIYQAPQKVTAYDNTLIKESDYEKQVTIEYTNPLTEDSKLEAGYDGLYNNLDLNFYGEYFDAARSRFVKDAIKSNRFIYKEDIHALYATYQKSFEGWGYSIGVRTEQAFTKSHLVTLDSFVTNNYFNLYPTLHLSYNLKEGSELQLNYSKRVNRPEGDELNPFPEYQDPRNLRAGNPKLLPEITHSIEGGYKWQNKNFSVVPSLYYRYKKNGFTSVVVLLNDTTLLTTTQNLSNDQAAGLEMIFSAKGGKWFSATLSSNVFYNIINAANLGYLKNRSILSMSTNLNTTFTITKTTMLQVSANYRSARFTPQGKTYATLVTNTGLRQDLLNTKLSITLTASDVFNALRQKTEITLPYLHQVSVNKRDGRIIYVGISYRFGAAKKSKEEKMQFDNNL